MHTHYYRGLYTLILPVVVAGCQVKSREQHPYSQITLIRYTVRIYQTE
jgi:hypothetical protein